MLTSFFFRCGFRYNTATREVIAGLNYAAEMLGLEGGSSEGGAEAEVSELALPVKPEPPPPKSSKRKKSGRSRASKAVKSENHASASASASAGVGAGAGASDEALVLAPPSAAGSGKHPVQTVVVLLPPDKGAEPAATITAAPAATSSIVVSRPNSNLKRCLNATVPLHLAEAMAGATAAVRSPKESLRLLPL